MLGRGRWGDALEDSYWRCCSVAKSHWTLCHPMDCSTPGFPVLQKLPRVCSNSCPLSWWYCLTISSSAAYFSLCLPSFWAWGSFPMSWLLTSGSQSIGEGSGKPTPVLLPGKSHGWRRSLVGYSQSGHRVRHDSVTSLTFIIFPTFESLNWIFPATPSFQHFLSFWARCLLQSFRKLKFFPLRELCKDWNTWTSEGAMSGEHSRWIRTSQPRKQLSPQPGSFCLIIKKSVLPQWKILCFLLTISRRFLLNAFSLSILRQYLLELIRLVFWKELIMKDSLPILSYTQYHFLWRLAFGAFGLTHDLFYSTLLLPTFIACHNLF